MRLLPAALVLVLASACSEKSSPPPAPEAAKPAEMKAPPPAAEAAKPAEPAPAAEEAAAARPIDACKLFDAETLTALVGAGGTTQNIGDQQCELKGDKAGYEIAVRHENAAREMEDWRTMSMAEPQPLAGIGDEAFTVKAGNVIIVRKGNHAARINASGVMPGAPLKAKEGVELLAKKVAEKL